MNRIAENALYVSVLVGILIFLLPPLGVIVSLVALIISIMGLKGMKRKSAILGLIISGVALLIVLIVTVGGLAVHI